MSWHDNHIHGLHVVEGDYGSGKLIIDLDYIVEWLKSESGGVDFAIAPATLTFLEVTALNVSINYKTMGAALGPFSISGIERRLEERERYTATVWRIPINFPAGEIEFESVGFSQLLRAKPVITDKQWLTEDERASI